MFRIHTYTYNLEKYFVYICSSFREKSGTGFKTPNQYESNCLDVIHELANICSVACFSFQELQFEDAKRTFEESQRINRRLTELYVKHNTAGKTYDEFFEVMKFDTFLSAEEAVAYGLADSVVERR